MQPPDIECDLDEAASNSGCPGPLNRQLSRCTAVATVSRGRDFNTGHGYDVTFFPIIFGTGVLLDIMPRN